MNMIGCELTGFASEWKYYTCSLYCFVCFCVCCQFSLIERKSPALTLQVLVSGLHTTVLCVELWMARAFAPRLMCRCVSASLSSVSASSLYGRAHFQAVLCIRVTISPGEGVTPGNASFLSAVVRADWVGGSASQLPRDWEKSLQ